MALPVHTPAAQVLRVEVIAAAEMSDAELGAAAADAVDRSLASRADSVEHAIRAGELLRVAKDRCRAQGTSWRDWCARHWRKSRKTADTYIAVAMEVSPSSSGGRAPHISKALTAPSVRALLTDADIGAGGTRDRSEPDGMREPGADEDEDDLSNAPTDPLMREPTEREQATVDRLAREKEDAKERREGERARKRQEQLDRERAERNKRAREQAEEPQGGPITSPDEIARRAEASRRAAEERAALEAARRRNPLKDPPPPDTIPKPVREPRGLYTIRQECEEIAKGVEALLRRACDVEVSDELPADAPWRTLLADVQNGMTGAFPKLAVTWRQIGLQDEGGVVKRRGRST